MVITHLHWSGRPIIGGIERHLDSLIPALQDRGHKSILLCGMGDESTGYQKVESGLKLSTDFDIDKFLQKNEEILGNSSVFHFHNGHVISPEKTLEIYQRIDDKTPKILSIHNIAENPESREIVDLPFDKVITYSSFMRDSVRRVYGIDSVVMPCYVTLLESSYGGSREGSTPQVLQPTRFSKWKGSHLSVECITDLIEEGYDLTFVHGGSERLLFDEWPKNSESLGKYLQSGQIVFRDYNFDEIGNAIQNSDLIIHPTVGSGVHGEPFSISCLESIVYGKQIIASRSGYLPSLLEGYSLGTLVDVRDKDGLYNAIKASLENRFQKPNSNDRQVMSRLRDYIRGGLEAHELLYGSLAN